MSKTNLTKSNALTIVGTSMEDASFVLSIPKRGFKALMETIASLIQRDGYEKATKTIVEHDWLKLDPSTKAEESKYAIAGYGIALPVNGKELAKAKKGFVGRFIKIAPDYITRHSWLERKGKDGAWSTLGAGSSIPTPNAKRAMGSAKKSGGRKTATGRKQESVKPSVVMTNEQVIDYGKAIAKSDRKKGAEFVIAYYKGDTADALADLLIA